MRVVLVLSGVVLALGLAACVTPERRASEIAGLCDARPEDGWAVMAPPSDAQTYRDALSPENKRRYFGRGWPFHEYWFRNGAARSTVICNANPDWRRTREQLCDRHTAVNGFYASFQNTPNGPVKVEEEGTSICVT